MSNHRFFPYMVLFTGVLIAATSAIFIRFAQAEGTPSLAIAAWRLAVAALILTPLVGKRRSKEVRRLRRQDVGWSALSGLFLAVHMVAWVTSLEFTSVASAAGFVTSYPLWVALFAFLLFGERPTPYTFLGLVIAMAGSSLIALSDGGILVVGPTATSNALLQFNWQNLVAPSGKADTALWGDGLALAAAMLGAGYFLVGRSLRRRLSTPTYVWLTYSSAATVLIGMALIAGTPLSGYSAIVYLWLLLLGLGPQLLGHTSFNWALAYLSATFVSISILGEPIGSAIFAYFIFGETVRSLQLVGFVLLLIGITLGVMGERQS